MSGATVYVARHGEVDNPEGIVYGHLPGFRLTPRGREQARAIGRYLRGHGVAEIISSPLLRAQETARIARRHLDPNLPLRTTGALTEARFGLYLQGVRFRDIRFHRPRWWIHRMHRGLLPDDESVADLAGRLMGAMAAARERTGDQPVLMVTHGDVIEAFWCQREGRPDFHHLRCDRGGLLAITWADAAAPALRYLSPDAIATGSDQPEGGPAPTGS